MKTVGTTPPARGELRCERLADDTLLVHLVGHWTIRAGAPVVNEVYQQLDASPPVRRLAFAAQELTAWDSRLLTLLRQVMEASTHRQIVVAYDEGDLADRAFAWCWRQVFAAEQDRHTRRRPRARACSSCR